MTERLVIAAIVLAGLSGLPGLLLRRASPVGERLSLALLALGSACGLSVAVAILAFGARLAVECSWAVPGGSVALRCDALSAMFLAQIFVVAPLGAVYGVGYFPATKDPDAGVRLRLWYGLTTAGLATVVSAHNMVLFLFGWELMAISAFFAMTTDDGDPNVREAGYAYLIATRIGTLCIIAFFAILYTATGSYDFAIPANIQLGSGLSSTLFLLALAGFGLKAGIMPLHVWLPGAHANAPSHVSALMSGVLIKMGIYGLLRVTALFPHPPLWWGALLLGLGVTSGVLGVAFAIGQHDIKRLLAYHSVENIGIIVLGIGLAELGRTLDLPDLIVLGLGGAALHVWNHGLFKALLFLGAGSVAHATGTRDIDRLGGLAKRMPYTALGFVLGAVAICGLPPLNGFVSEYLLYIGMFRATSIAPGRTWIGPAFAAPALALIGALAVACFVKVFGAVFLGEPRSRDAEDVHEAPRSMLGPMAVLAALCLCIGIAPPLVAPTLDAAADAWTIAPQAFGHAESLPVGAPSGFERIAALAPLSWITTMGIVLVALVLVLAVLLRRRRGTPTVPTWDCGYAAPTSSMQYTASSFAEMIVELFAWALRPKVHAPRLVAPFPLPATFHAEVRDTVIEVAVAPVARATAKAVGYFRWVQQGNTHAYILYVLVAVIVSLFLWR